MLPRRLYCEAAIPARTRITPEPNPVNTRNPSCRYQGKSTANCSDRPAGSILPPRSMERTSKRCVPFVLRSRNPGKNQDYAGTQYGQAQEPELPVPGQEHGELQRPAGRIDIAAAIHGADFEAVRPGRRSEERRVGKEGRSRW